ncbi:hypothetical protein Lal_00050189 [Lupinus albus]|nr:hypothetical protein Lal_00050189 [Lupinus albus]
MPSQHINSKQCTLEVEFSAVKEFHNQNCVAVASSMHYVLEDGDLDLVAAKGRQRKPAAPTSYSFF